MHTLRIPAVLPVDATSSHAPLGCDPDAYVHIDDFVALIKDTPGWTIQTNDTRSRPPGAATAAHHVHDVVLRARRSG